MSHRRPIRSFAVACTTALTLVALAGCGDGDESAQTSDPASNATPTDSGSEQPSAAEESSAPAPVPGAPVVEVLDPGTDPQEVLALDLEEGQVERSVMEMTMVTEVAGASVEVPMTMELSTTVESVSDSEIVARSDYESVEAKLPPGAGLEANEAFDALEEMSATTRFTPSGASLGTELDVPDDLPPSMASTIDQLGSQFATLTVPFPSEPVGEGASWKVQNELELTGLTAEQTMTYTLVSWSGSDYTVEVDIEQVFQPGEVSGLQVVEGSSTGTSTFSGSVDRMMAADATSTVDGSITMESGGQTIESRTSVQIDMTTTVE